MRQIKASEVKPGMVVRWMDKGFSRQGAVDRVTHDYVWHTTQFTSGVFTTPVRSETPVTVLSEPRPDEPTAVVPERIEEWPEDDTSLRKHKWWDAVGDLWECVDGRWWWGDGLLGGHDTPRCGPWERETDA